MKCTLEAQYVLIFAVISSLAYILVDETSFQKIHSYAITANDCDVLPTIQSTRVIHQAYDTEPDEYPAYYKESWLTLHRTWTYVLWNDDSNRKLVHCRLPEFKRTYESLNIVDQREFAKFAYLYVYGGLYVDFDYAALQSHEKLFTNLERDSSSLMLTEKLSQGLSWTLSIKRGHTLFLTCMKEFKSDNDAANCVSFFTQGRRGAVQTGQFKDVWVVEEAVLSPQRGPDDMACEGVAKESTDWWFEEFYSGSCFKWLLSRDVFAFNPREISEEGRAESKDPGRSYLSKLLQRPTKSESLPSDPGKIPSKPDNSLKSSTHDSPSKIEPEETSTKSDNFSPPQTSQLEPKSTSEGPQSSSPKLSEPEPKSTSDSQAEKPSPTTPEPEPSATRAAEPDTPADPCDDLPKAPTDGGYSKFIHQTYKTSNRSLWPSKWDFFYDSWDEVHPDWQHIFWTDEMNMLLIECHFPAFEKKYKNVKMKWRGGVKRADFMRHAYLYHYGGVYADMDYLALQRHDWFFEYMEKNNVSALLSNEKSHTIALEWAMSARPGHRLWHHCMMICDPNKEPDPVETTGPEFVKQCLYTYYNHSHPVQDFLGHDFRLKPKRYKDVYLITDNYVSPMHWWTKKECPCLGAKSEDDAWFRANFSTSGCRQWLSDINSFAWTVYTSSWSKKHNRRLLDVMLDGLDWLYYSLMR